MGVGSGDCDFDSINYHFIVRNIAMMETTKEGKEIKLEMMIGIQKRN